MSNLQDLTYDPSDAEILRDPHALFARMRSSAPVLWSAPLSAWIVTSYDLVNDVLTDSATFSAERLSSVRKHLPPEGQSTAAEILRWLNHWMVFRDPPDHSRLRRHMAGVLNPPLFNSLESSVLGVIDLLLDRLPRSETFDFVREFAIMMPGMVIMDLFGVDRDRLLEVKQWSDDMMLFIGSARGVPNKYERARSGALSMASLFQQLIADRRAAPADDILSKLIASQINGRAMTDDELIGSMMMVLNGGHETTANLLNNTMLALLRNPDQLSMAKNRAESVTGVIEESLRFDGPILSIGRVVTKACSLGEQEIAAGDRVFAMLVAANRDQEVFVNPDIFDGTRSPNPHMAFGKGPHFCLGAPLARLEGQLAFRGILSRYRSISLADDMSSTPWINSLVTRGPTRLPLRFE